MTEGFRHVFESGTQCTVTFASVVFASRIRPLGNFRSFGVVTRMASPGDTVPPSDMYFVATSKVMDAATFYVMDCSS